jgi:tRNA nucleotidyltransferase (CCA-adding enzyme)
MQKYMVGGYVRDKIMGVKSKDIDYTVVLDPEDFPTVGTTVVVPDPYTVMVGRLEDEGVRIIRDKFTGMPIGADYFTCRGIHSEFGPVDYVLARKERGYADGRRPDSVEVGTLYDDLSRRDFTMNAIAIAEDGSFIDPFNGQADISARVIKAVGDAQERLTEDALRAVRAMRFSITKGMAIDPALRFAMETAAVLDSIRTNISDERIDEEIRRMFAFDNMTTLRVMNKYDQLTAAMLSGSVSITSTMKSIKSKG